MAKRFVRAINSVAALLGGKKTKLRRISLEDLRLERLRIEQEQKRIVDELERLDREKQSLFLQGKDNPAMREILAGKIRENHLAAESLRARLAFFSQQMRFVNGLIRIKENEGYWKTQGLWDRIWKIGSDTLQEYIDESMLKEQFQREKFAELLKGMEAPVEARVPEEDKAIVAIVEQMAEAKAAEESGKGEELAERIKRVEEVLRREEEKQEEPET